jgi:hypothetical protein
MINQIRSGAHLLHPCRKFIEASDSVHCGIQVCENDSLSIHPMRDYVRAPDRCKLLFNLKGDVSEWAQDEGITVGGSWHDPLERINACDTFHVDTPNAWTGFRCVCRWRRWD